MLLVTALVMLGGCASFSFQTQFAHESELIAKRGQPTRMWDNQDGTRTLEYATQPYGETCWMYTVDARGTVVQQYDALTHRNLANVRAGMTVGEVQRMLGQHRSMERFARSGEEVWDWNVANEWPGVLATYFNVHFIGGVVERTSFTYLYPNDGDLGGWFGNPFGSHWSYGVGFGHGSGFGFGHHIGYGHRLSYGHGFGSRFGGYYGRGRW